MIVRSMVGASYSPTNVVGSRCMAGDNMSARKHSAMSGRGCRKRSILGRLGMNGIHIWVDMNGKNLQYITNI